MAEKELGSSSKPPQPSPQQQSQSNSTPTTPARTLPPPIAFAHEGVVRQSSTNGSASSGSAGAITPTGDSARAAATGWTTAVRQMVWEKWRWGVVDGEALGWYGCEEL